MADKPALSVADNPAHRRYEAHLAGELAGFSQYRLEGDRVVVTHTQVDPAFEGGGVGSGLVRYLLDDIRRRELKVVPLCPFVRSYIRRHPDYADLVAERGSAADPPA